MMLHYLSTSQVRVFILHRINHITVKHHEHTLHLKGRTPTFYNIMGALTSIHDLTNVLNLQGCTLSAKDHATHYREKI